MIKKGIHLMIVMFLVSTFVTHPSLAEEKLTNVLNKEKELQLLDNYLQKFYEKATTIRGKKLVLSTHTKDIKELPVTFVKSFRNIEKYERRKLPFVVRYAAIDYKMSEENRYAINGINYRVVIYTQQDGIWQVAEMGLVPVDLVAANHLGFGTEDEKEMVKISQARDKGIYLNRKGEEIDKDNVATTQDLHKEMNGNSSLQAAGGKWLQFVPEQINLNYKRPKTIKVLMTTLENKKAYNCDKDCVKEIDFLAYIQNVFSTTWPKDAPIEALKAGALAVKMYSWFSVVVDPTAHRMNADVIDTDPGQTYIATYTVKDDNEKAQIEKMRNIFHAVDVAGIGFKDGLSHKLFLPETATEFTLEPASGLLSRQGAVELAKQGKDAAEILQHYYEGSERMEEAVSPLTFFRYAD
ncbi:hypothetical protein LOZ80_28555 [Paenibacillus sp. HWE-109]|uniref:SpoIID/LytB domain-containing protein n=1 Tax=Paenibacillus sp. HWE-109 TaxID=1306526 RepID=UPI001EDE8581|nr:SpoIID/LytB domain-containing protein [Paenibacillus sp. HWE-109]UKS25509.1 hypothetical protein LOZ80_28555 [Paenibacillus sp. HWE-109]